MFGRVGAGVVLGWVGTLASPIAGIQKRHSIVIMIWGWVGRLRRPLLGCISEI